MVRIIVQNKQLKSVLGVAFLVVISLGFGGNIFGQQKCSRIKLYNLSEATVKLPILYEDRISRIVQIKDTLLIELIDLSDGINSSHKGVTLANEPVNIAYLNLKPNEMTKYSVFNQNINLLDISYIIIKGAKGVNIIKKRKRNLFEIK